MSKYYTPEIEEFHHGFIYEVYDLHYHSDKMTWEKEVYGVTSEITEGCRVKYLDREDIESLGWKFERKLGDAYEFSILLDPFRHRRRTTIRMAYNSVHHWIAIVMIDEKFNEINEQYENPLFSGKIKNKSELGRVLKMVGVI